MRNTKKLKQAGRGRRKGVPNKATADVRAAIAKVAEANVEKLSGWLSRIEVDIPQLGPEALLEMAATISRHEDRAAGMPHEAPPKTQ